MFVPLILSALLPLNPMLFLRELIAWFVGIFLQIVNGDLVVGLEDMIATLIHARARQMLGQPPRGGRRRTARSSYRLTGHPPSFAEIEQRFHRALARLADVEHLAARRSAKIARLLEQAASQFEVVHHPVEPSTSTTTTISLAPDSRPTILLAPA